MGESFHHALLPVPGALWQKGTHTQRSAERTDERPSSGFRPEVLPFSPRIERPSNVAMLALGGVGLVVLGGLAFFAARRR